MINDSLLREHQIDLETRRIFLSSLSLFHSFFRSVFLSLSVRSCFSSSLSPSDTAKTDPLQETKCNSFNYEIWLGHLTHMLLNTCRKLTWQQRRCRWRWRETRWWTSRHRTTSTPASASSSRSRRPRITSSHSSTSSTMRFVETEVVFPMAMAESWACQTAHLAHLRITLQKWSLENHSAKQQQNQGNAKFGLWFQIECKMCWTGQHVETWLQRQESSAWIRQ